MKRFLSVFLMSILITMSFSALNVFAAEPQVEGTTAILIDAHSGQQIWEKNKDVQMAPASLTKMMTAILTVENLEMDTVVTADEEAAGTEEMCIHMKVGEEFTVEQLLKAMIIGSENDCAVALAKTMSGSIKDFTNLMNGRAKELGCKNTHFVNPNGLPGKGHLSTAADMAIIAKKFMEYEELRDIAKKTSYTIKKTNKSAKRKIHSSNRMLYDKQSMCEVNGKQEPCYYKYAIGIKTGFTQAAQSCLAAAAKKGDTELIAIVLHSSDLNRYGDTKSMLKYGFNNTKTYDIYKPGDEVGKIKVKGSKAGKTPCVATYYVSANIKGEKDKKNIRTEVDYVDKIIAPVAKGTVVGHINVYDGDKLVSSTAVKTAEKAEEGVFGFVYTHHVAHPVQLAFVIILFIIALLLAGIILLRLKYRRQRMRRKRRRNMKK